MKNIVRLDRIINVNVTIHWPADLGLHDVNPEVG